MRVGISTTETDPEALLARVLGSSEMAGAELAGEVTTTEAYVVPGRRPRSGSPWPPSTSASRG